MGGHLVQIDGASCDSQPSRAKALATALPSRRDLHADRVEVGLAFHRALLSTCVSTEQIARRCGIAHSLVKRIRRGEVALGLWHWLRLPDAVRVAVEVELSKSSTRTVTR